MKYALINFKGQRLKDDLEWDGTRVDGMYAKVGKDYYNVAELWPMSVADQVEEAVSKAQALVKQAEDNHAKVFYELRNQLTRGELK